MVYKIWLEWFEVQKPIWHYENIFELEWTLFEWIGVEAQSLKAKMFIGDRKGVIQMHWVAKMHLESEGMYLNLT